MNSKLNEAGEKLSVTQDLDHVNIQQRLVCALWLCLWSYPVFLISQTSTVVLMWTCCGLIVILLVVGCSCFSISSCRVLSDLGRCSLTSFLPEDRNTLTVLHPHFYLFAAHLYL